MGREEYGQCPDQMVGKPVLTKCTAYAEKRSVRYPLPEDENRVGYTRHAEMGRLARGEPPDPGDYWNEIDFLIIMPTGTILSGSEISGASSLVSPQSTNAMPVFIITVR